MNNTQITIRINSETKAKAHSLFNSLGLDLSTAINMFLNEAIEFQGIPFIVRKRGSDPHSAIVDMNTAAGFICPYGAAVADAEDNEAV